MDNNPKESSDYLCAALDGFDLLSSSDELKTDVTRRLENIKKGNVGWVKIGMELYYSAEFDIIGLAKSYDFKIFLDLKLKDIAYNTIRNTAAVLTAKGVDIFNVHADGGSKMMKAAVDGSQIAAEQLGIDRPKIIAVTVLTSISYEELKEVGISAGFVDKCIMFTLSFLGKDAFNFFIKKQVLRLAKLAAKCGLDGIVSSALDLSGIFYKLPKGFLFITPAIRFPKGDSTGQERVATPDFAVREGATLLVVGRPFYDKLSDEEQVEAMLLMNEMILLYVKK